MLPNDDIPYIVNPISVSVNNDKKRLILDLRHVNKHVYKDKIKFHDWKVMKDYLKPNNFLFKFDITQGYHHIDIHPDFQKYLGFSWFYEGKLHHFVFLVLPFGLTSAPFIFTKVMRCLVKFWRFNSIQIAVYLDDGLGVSDSLLNATRHSTCVRTTLIIVAS